MSTQNDTRIVSVDQTTSTGHRLYNYDGICNHLHGHNLRWVVDVTVEMPTDNSNMPVDLKDIKDVIDVVDHALILNADDQLVDLLEEHDQRVLPFPGDPTCEAVSEHMAVALLKLDPVQAVDLTLHETRKYSISAHVDRWSENRPRLPTWLREAVE